MGGFCSLKGDVGSPAPRAALGRPSSLRERLPPSPTPRVWTQEVAAEPRVLPSSGRLPGVRRRGAVSGEACRGGGDRAGQTGLWDPRVP